MRYIKFEGDAGYCGTEYIEYIAFPDNTSDDFLEAYSEELIEQTLSDYEYLAISADMNIIEQEEAIECYYENSGDGYWEEVSEEEWKENNGIFS